jgi:hypothetical protein
MDIHTTEPLVPESSLVEMEIAIGKLKTYNSPGTEQIPAELIKAGGEVQSDSKLLSGFPWPIIFKPETTK